MDFIEKSNLNCQFFFWVVDVGYMKSDCVGRVVQRMNFDFEGYIISFKE